jgi:glycosyltransferase involved in cell wall biosynthesis
MKRILLPTLESTEFKGGVARYLEAIVLTYPSVQVHTFKHADNYFDFFSYFFTTSGAADLYFISHVLPLGTVAWLTGKFTKKPYVIFLHGMDFDLARRNSWKRFLLNEILKGASRVVVNTEALQKEVVSFMGEVETPVVLYPTVSDDLVKASEKNRKGLYSPDLVSLAKLAAGAMGGPVFPTTTDNRQPTMPITLLTVARLVERKGHLKVLEVLERLPGVKYHIVGDGELRGRLEAEIMHRGLTDRVTITTNAKDEDLPKMYTDADIFVMPTSKTEMDREGFGIVYLEAQLFGLPVIATNYPGVNEAVEEGNGGMLIEDNVDALETAIRKLIDESATRSRLGSRGRERVLSTFTREKQMEKLREFLV